MTAIIDISLPAGQFALGRLLDEYPDVEIELENIVPMREGIIPLFWVEGAAEDAVEKTLRADTTILDVQLLTTAGDRSLFKAVWSPEVNALVRPMIDSGAEVLIGTGTADHWQFRLQFPDRDALTAFRDAARANDIDFDLDALYNPTIPDLDGERGPLTAEQEDMLHTAYEHGYWEIPRGVTIQELADIMGLSDTAVSQRLRRGTNALVGATVMDHDWPP